MCYDCFLTLECISQVEVVTDSLGTHAIYVCSVSKLFERESQTTNLENDD